MQDCRSDAAGRSGFGPLSVAAEGFGVAKVATCAYGSGYQQGNGITMSFGGEDEEAERWTSGEGAATFCGHDAPVSPVTTPRCVLLCMKQRLFAGPRGKGCFFSPGWSGSEATVGEDDGGGFGVGVVVEVEVVEEAGRLAGSRIAPTQYSHRGSTGQDGREEKCGGMLRGGAEREAHRIVFTAWQKSEKCQKWSKKGTWQAGLPRRWSEEAALRVGIKRGRRGRDTLLVVARSGFSRGGHAMPCHAAMRWNLEGCFNRWTGGSVMGCGFIGGPSCRRAAWKEDARTHRAPSSRSRTTAAAAAAAAAVPVPNPGQQAGKQASRAGATDSNLTDSQQDANAEAEQQQQQQQQQQKQKQKRQQRPNSKERALEHRRGPREVMRCRP
ncbi:hypothetical protein B0J11DRAFT_600839 [Dendryphion nanum]|uniref:Uncharacterized protein n=1 Tax=Dendryphion nanum TaxID=256645 RepID=A0A9P9E9D3_9PLEO|nr:hypothetical protein B0J11DRAFT_600839 [Dendryphion nanum]